MAQYTQINPDALVTALTPINNSLGGKQDKTDNTLATTDKTISGAINEINTKVGNLTGALTWKGKFDILPAVTDYEAGNVIGVGNKEYVLTVTGSTKTWEELGDEGSYLLKSTAEETYLKKAAGAITTANIADGAVISTKLVTGARRPIILTPDTTEVDEETYQKLLSDDVDVIFKTSTEDANLCTLTYKAEDGNYWSLYFTCFSREGSSLSETYLYGYEVEITKTGNPHPCKVTDNSGEIQFDLILLNEGFIRGYDLFPVLQQIDLTGTDADRKAKLDQFANNWKTLTGASDLTGARFVGSVETPGGDSTMVFTFTWNDVFTCYTGVGFDDTHKDYKCWVQSNGILIVTPLFSHLEPAEIFYSDFDKRQNLDNLNAYKKNLDELGIDTTKGFQVPFTMQGSQFIGSLFYAKDTNKYIGLEFISDENLVYRIEIDGHTGQYSEIGLALDEDVQKLKADKSLNAKAFEAITIRIDNTPESKAANVAAIEAYEDNLEALGFDMTKGYMIPITASGRNGFLSTRSGNYPYAGYVATDSSVNDFYNILILGNGEYYDSKIQSENSSELNTISNKLVPAINEVNTLAKNKQDKLTSGTNIKTINNQSLLGSGNIEISAPSITVDTSMSDTSTNPVQNKVIKAYIDGLVGNVEAQLAAI